jgi:uncharacterized RDD family membrane protein YckC
MEFRHDPRMTTLVVPTSEGVDLRQDIAGAGSRFAAGLLDLILIALGYLAAVIVVIVAWAIDPTGLSTFVAGVLVGGAVLVVLGYHVLFHVFGSGQTPGKRALGIRVLSTDGHPATPFQIVLRALILPVDILIAVPVPVGLTVIGTTAMHQRLGDLFAGTLVVRSPRSDRAREPFERMQWSTLQRRTLSLTPGTAAHLSAEDRAFLRDLLTRPELSEERRRALFVDAAKHYAARLGLGPFTDARTVILELYLFAREHPGRG